MKRILLFAFLILFILPLVNAGAFQVGVVVAIPSNGTGNGSSNGTNTTVITTSTPKPVQPTVGGGVPTLAYSTPEEIRADIGGFKEIDFSITNPSIFPQPIKITIVGSNEVTVAPDSTTIQPNSAVVVVITYRPKTAHATSAIIRVSSENKIRDYPITLLPNGPPNVDEESLQNGSKVRVNGSVETTSSALVQIEIRDSNNKVVKTINLHQVDGIVKVDYTVDLRGLPAGNYEGCIVAKNTVDKAEKCSSFTIQASEINFPLGITASMNSIIITVVALFTMMIAFFIYRRYM